MGKRGRKRLKSLLWAFIILAVFTISLIILVKAGNSESSSEWWMTSKYLNHTAWDGVDFTVIGMNYSIFHVSDYIGFFSSPPIANGYIYAVDGDAIVYQLNASNVSRHIANFTAEPAASHHSPAVANSYVYIDYGEHLYQLNASNVSQKIANFSAGPNPYASELIIANNSVYIGWNTMLYQLNASNVSRYIANNTIVARALAYAYGSVYVGSNYAVYQLNASNLSHLLGNFTHGVDFFSIPPAVYNGSVYIPNSASSNQAYLFQLNASNISINHANFSLGKAFDYMSPAIAYGSVYIGGGAGSPVPNNYVFYQLNVSNISMQIANYTPGGYAITSATVAEGSVYIGASDNYMYQLNATNISNLIGRTYLGSTPYSPAYAKGFIYFGSDNYNLYQVNASNLGLFNITDIIPPDVLLTANLNVNMPGEMNLNIFLNEHGYCEYSFDAGKTNSTFGFYSPTAYVFSQGFTSLLERSYTVHAYCNDTSGNRNDTATVTFTITYPTSGGGSTVTTTTTPTPITEGEPTTVPISNPGIEVGGVSITTTENVSSVSVTVQEVNRSRLADFEIGVTTRQIYQALNISVKGLNNSQIENATVYFRVNISWVEDLRRYTEEDVRLFRRNDATNRWQALPTTLLSNDSQYYYYSAITPGFSTFVIFYGRYDCEPGISRCFESQVQMCLGNATWLTTEKCTYGCDNQGACLESLFQSKTFYTLLIAVVSVGIVVVFYIVFVRIFKRKKGRR